MAVKKSTSQRRFKPSPLDSLLRPLVKSPCLFLGEGPGELGLLNTLFRCFRNEGGVVTCKPVGGCSETKWVNAVKTHAPGNNHIFMLFDADTTCRKEESDDHCSAKKIEKIKAKCKFELPCCQWNGIILRPCLEGLLLKIYGEREPNSSAECKKMFNFLAATKKGFPGQSVSAASLTKEDWDLLFPQELLLKASGHIPSLYGIVNFISTIE